MLNNLVIYFTDPSKEMLLGFSYSEAIGYDEDHNPIVEMCIFSIGLFALRFDYYFNTVDYDETI